MSSETGSEQRDSLHEVIGAVDVLVMLREEFEQWQEEGSLDAARRANAAWKRALADYEPPPMEPAVEEELAEFVARRRAEIGDGTT